MMLKIEGGDLRTCLFPTAGGPNAQLAADLLNALAKALDLLVIGAAKEPVFRKMLVGEIPQKVARYSPASVLVVKRYEGPVKTLIKRIMG